jgi:3-deoxy-manno-octulosonate cytidylyltransferase (CMP-KDO synthetase)
MSTAALLQDDPAEYRRPSVVKVVVDARGDALYFSRSPIPHYRDAGTGRYRKHLGIYGYRREFLFRVAALSPSRLEEAERLEQLRVLENGHRIRVVDVAHDSVGVDTPEDLKAVEGRLCGPKRR